MQTSVPDPASTIVSTVASNPAAIIESIIENSESPESPEVSEETEAVEAVEASNAANYNVDNTNNAKSSRAFVPKTSVNTGVTFERTLFASLSHDASDDHE